MGKCGKGKRSPTARRPAPTLGGGCPPRPSAVLGAQLIVHRAMSTADILCGPAGPHALAAMPLSCVVRCCPDAPIAHLGVSCLQARGASASATPSRTLCAGGAAAALSTSRRAPAALAATPLPRSASVSASGVQMGAPPAPPLGRQSAAAGTQRALQTQLPGI